MGAAKAVSLKARPYQVAHLCFEVDGVLEYSLAELGSPTKAFDFPKFYATLGAMPSIAGNPSRLRYDFLEIEADIKTFMLAAVRKEARKASLNQAVNMRQNAFLSKYGSGPAIIAKSNQFYSPAVTGSKPNRLATLAWIAQQQANELKTAYEADARTGVVRQTSSVLDSMTESSGSSDGTSQRDALTISDQEPAGKTYASPPAGGRWGAIVASGGGPLGHVVEEDTSGDHTDSSGYARQHQRISNTDFGYRTPYLESQAQNERAQISLMDQQFAQFLSSQNLPFLGQVLFNELNSMDGDVYKLQVALLNTYLLSPIEGIVTGQYKHPGDAVRAGETVFRVENNTTILVEANVVYRGPVGVGSTVTITTALFDAAGPATTVMGLVVAARGQSDDDRWELVVKCPNIDSSGNPIVPLGYHFDYGDDTTVSIT